MKTTIAMIVMWAWIILVSLVDFYWSIKLESTLLSEEKNPVGIWLLELDNGSVALFMTVKMLFLWLMVIFSYIILKWKPWMALVSTAFVALFQLGLVWFFIFG